MASETLSGLHLSRVVCNRSLGAGAWLLRLHAPSLAATYRPGLFVGVAVAEAGSYDPFLRRPFSIMRVRPDAGGAPSLIDLLHVVVGRGTRWMAELREGDEVELLGPLGNSFFDPEFKVIESGDAIVIAAGGVGVAPFFGVVEHLIAQGCKERITFFYGARTRAALAGLNDLQELGIQVAVATDDGSLGQKGFVTQLVDEALAAHTGRSAVVLACGPDPMMHATGKVAARRGARCLVSLESPMPCGFGACYGCVVYSPARDGRPARYIRACIEGPILSTAILGWDS